VRNPLHVDVAERMRKHLYLLAHLLKKKEEEVESFRRGEEKRGGKIGKSEEFRAFWPARHDRGWPQVPMEKRSWQQFRGGGEEGERRFADAFSRSGRESKNTLITSGRTATKKDKRFCTRRN